MVYEDHEKRWKEHWFNFIINNDQDWDYRELMKNPNLDLNLVLEHLDKPWDMGKLSLLIKDDDTFEDFNIIEDNLSLPWELIIISQHKNVRVDILRQYSKIPWDYYSLTRDIDFELIMENLDLPWDFKYLSTHPDLNNEILKQNIDLDWDFEYLSSSIYDGYKDNIVELVLLFPDKDWNFRGLSCHKNISNDIVEKLIDKDWNFGQEGLSLNSSITLKLVLKYPEKDWHYGFLGLVNNESITWEDVKNNPQIKWDYNCLCSNKNITWEIFQENQHLLNQNGDSYDALSYNPNITLDLVLQNLDKEWNYKFILRDNIESFSQIIGIPDNYISKGYVHTLNNLTIEIVLTNLDYDWNFDSLSIKFIQDNETNLKEYPDFPWDFHKITDSIQSLELILANIDRDWDFKVLSGKVNEMNNLWDIVRAYPDKEWSYPILSRNKPPLEIVYENPNKDWDYFWSLSKLSNISWVFIEDNMDKKWDFALLCQKNNIDWDVVIRNFEKFNCEKLYENPLLTWEIVKKHIQFPWDFGYLSKSKSVTWDLVETNIDKDWCFHSFDDNPSISYQLFLDKKEQYGWDHFWYSANPNLSFEIVFKNLHEEWDFEELSKNSMYLEKENFIRKCFQEDFMRPGGVAEDLMKNRFHPNNVGKFSDWGFDDFDV